MATLVILSETLFGKLDFNKVKDYNEADVRANIIDPILKGLGFSADAIEREKHFEKRSNKKQKEYIVPGYLLKVCGCYAWVLEAKSADKKITDKVYVDQAYEYAAHREIHSKYFALCNGLEFTCFRTSEPDKPILHILISEIDTHWDELNKLLSVDSFQSGKRVAYIPNTDVAFNYAIRPLLGEIPVKKREAKRHFGVNAYFTRQAWNVVSGYIKNFTQEGDVVLDPFGGSGVTAVEALMSGRKAVSLDINPLSVFIMQSLLTPVEISELIKAYNNVCEEYKKKEPKSKKEIKDMLKEYPCPKNLPLPQGSDVGYVADLFTEEQMAQLALLKSIIKKVKNMNVKKSLLLVFYNTVAVVNKTYHEMPKGGPVNFVMYYRYRIAPKPAYRNTLETFKGKFNRILAAKKEMERLCPCDPTIFAEIMNEAQIIKGSATDLSFLQNESVDYIYTDPPYGKKIPYLDLSTMWNAWLDLKVTENDYELEAIEGGEHNKTKEDYNRLIAESIREMYRVLKFDRWLSFVFYHKDPAFWHLINDTCEKCGFEYVGAVSQKNGHPSFKKKQHPFTVLSGELIINFRKVRNPRTMLSANLGMDTSEIIQQAIEGIIAKHNGATVEQINDELIIKGLELGFLHLLKKEYKDLEPLLRGFALDNETGKYTLKKGTTFQSKIDVKVRIRFYVTSYLRQMERESKIATFNDIVLNIMPLLKNGKTPDDQTIGSVLEDIGEKVGDDGWRLRSEEPNLFSRYDNE